MAGEAARRLVLVLGTLLAQLSVVVRALKWPLPLSSAALLRGLPALLLSFVALSLDAGAAGRAGGALRPHLGRAKSYTSMAAIGLALSALGEAAAEHPHGRVPALSLALLAHVCLSSAFKAPSAAETRARRGPAALWRARLVYLVLGSLAALGFVLLRPHLGHEHAGAVGVFVAADMVMLARAVNRDDPACGVESYRLSLLGAALLARE
jgi:hypothetical protein